MRFLAFLLICSTLISLTALSASALESGAVGIAAAELKEAKIPKGQWIGDEGFIQMIGFFL